MEFGDGAASFCDDEGLSSRSGTSNDCVMNLSPRGKKYWIPSCDKDSQPYVGQRFSKLDDGVDFYVQYACTVGFDVRRSTETKDRMGNVLRKYLVCSREGFKQPAKDVCPVGEGVGDSSISPKRRRVTNRVGCNAKIILKLMGDGRYSVFSVEIRHTHSLCSELAKPFMRVNRKLSMGHQSFVANCARANIGPIKSFKLYKQMVGDFVDVGATGVDFQNFKQDLMAWHACRYNLVFVPFTGMDNHKKSVTFAAGLIAKEDIDSYVWLLDNFKRAMGHEPTYVITDQDTSLRVAVPSVFKFARHQFCMWHIMTKVGDKVRAVLANDQPFRRDLNAIVWDECITIEQFESKWLQIMEDHGLVEHRWLQLMFELRAFWIPTFFRDLPMSGLVRTTSRSESQNSSFGGCTNCHASLVEFFIHFEGAIDSQRHKQAKLDASCEGYLPVVKTPLAIERYAAVVYTITVFYDVQAEIVAGCFECRVLSAAVDGDVKRVEVEGGNGVVCVVLFHMVETTASCSCRMFERVGLLCRHIFLIFKDARVESILACYVVYRWTRDAYKRPIYDIDGVHDAPTLAGKSSNGSMKEDLKMSFVDADSTMSLSVGKSGVIRSFGGVLASSKVVVHPPTVAKNKGSGKRFKTAKELALEKAGPFTRECATCHKSKIQGKFASTVEGEG
ncbi:protein FAR1-RELATED SEQUENCE 5-like [Ipomoea triloba]|uniref:protein FAR1-RELATED SEQUENCE 5-like n=1 Tax=Ipomoea triloba TaxID=35885 RepID=UPI00125CECDF|nr:protein FAR1-RELATED SEQUENCE 5-like [Ipomoea triloba]